MYTKQIHAAGDAIAMAHDAAGGRVGAGLPAGAARRRAARRRVVTASTRSHTAARATIACAGQSERGLPLRQPLCAC